MNKKVTPETQAHAGEADKKPTKHLSVYANLANKRRIKKDQASRAKAEYLATLPKHPVKRFLYRLNPQRLARYWFSKRGGMMALKILGLTLLALFLLVGGLFAYFRKDLDKIRPGEIAKRVQTTVTKYYDRNGVLLWEDKGTGNYKLVVESNQISDYLKKATVAIEDKDFYNHHGISVSGLMRATFSTASGKQVQGGSTLTQQLVKQVFFPPEEAGNRGIGGIPRKIKEIILAVEVERMYNKDQILSLYLNESPYGGRRNGAESAAQTYFHKSAKDLTLPEAALLAAIPQNPTYYDPYNAAGRKNLLQRQHTVLDYMSEQGYITKNQSDEAKKYPILDNIHPPTEQTEGVKAPHFLLMVRNQLEKELGKSVVGRGGLTVKTTLDWRVQEKLEAEMKSFFESGQPARVRISNGASAIEDVQTGQVIALMGSRDFKYPGFGQDNATTAYIQPGSSIKPFVYAKLFENRGSGQQNYGSGSVLKDENIDRIYGAQLRNWDNKFMGDISIRQSLALSRNIPAVKAMYITGNGRPQATVDYIRNVGNTEYCTPEENGGGYGLSAAIGGCGSKQLGLLNAYGTLARRGIERPSASVLEVKNSQGETLKKWKDDSKQAMDPQVAYIISDILADQNAARSLHGGATNIPGIKAAFKTGTTDRDSKPKDLWIASYTPALAMTLWLGNSDTSTISAQNSAFGMPVIRNVMTFAHKNVYAPENKWHANAWFERPSGIQQVGNELYPSWWNKNQGKNNSKVLFDRVSKKKATSCTPESAREELSVSKATDPLTKSEAIIAPSGYDATKDDDAHKCDDAKPQVNGVTVSNAGSNRFNVSVDLSKGTFDLATIDVLVDGKSVKSESISGNNTKQSATITVGDSGHSHTVTVNVRDTGYYTASASANFTS